MRLPGREWTGGLVLQAGSGEVFSSPTENPARFSPLPLISRRCIARFHHGQPVADVRFCWIDSIASAGKSLMVCSLCWSEFRATTCQALKIRSAACIQDRNQDALKKFIHKPRDRPVGSSNPRLARLPPPHPRPTKQGRSFPR